MSEFVPVVTDGMNKAGDFADEVMGEVLCFRTIFYAMAAHPDFRAQLRAWAAEEMRGLVPGKGSRVLDVQAQVWWNACRAEILANIERWEQQP